MEQARTTGRENSSGQDIWVANQEIIRNLYKTEQKPLRKVKEIMERDHGFPEFPVSIYETKLRDSLQMRKNLKKTDWPIIIHHVNERARRENKESDVYRYGVLIPKKTLGKEFHRHRQSVADLSSSRPPPIPPGVSIRTPSPVPVTPDFLTAALELQDDPTTLNLSLDCMATAHPYDAPVFQAEFPSMSSVSEQAHLSYLSPQRLPPHQTFLSSNPQTDLSIPSNRTPTQPPLCTLGEHDTTHVSTEILEEVFKSSLNNLPWHRFRHRLQRFKSFGDNFESSIDFDPTATASLGPDLLFGFEGPLSQAAPLLGFEDPFALTAPWTASALWTPQFPDSTTNKAGYLLSTLPTLANSLRDSLPMSESTALSNEFDALHFFEAAVFFLSNKAHHDNNAEEILWMFERVPETFLEAFFNNGEPSAAATLEALFGLVVKHKRTRIFQTIVYTATDVHRITLKECLTAAAKLDCSNVVQRLLQRHTRPPGDKLGDTAALIHAVVNGNVLITELLLKAGATVDFRQNTFTAVGHLLNVLVRERSNYDNRSQCLSLLLHAEADVDLPYAENTTYRASSETILDIAYLRAPEWYQHLKSYSQMSSDILSVSELIQAASAGPESVQRCLKLRRFPKGIQRFDIMRKALTCGAEAEYILAMLKAGISPTGVFGYRRVESSSSLESPSVSPLEHAVRDAMHNGLNNTRQEVILLMLERGATITEDIIEHAESGADTDVLRILLGSGPTLDNYRVHAMLQAARSNNFEAVKLLHSLGVNVNSHIDSELTIFQGAIEGDVLNTENVANVEMVKYLVSLGGDVNRRAGDVSVMTALEAAIRRKTDDRLEIVSLLINLGAEIGDISVGPKLLRACLRGWQIQGLRSTELEYLLNSGAAPDGFANEESLIARLIKVGAETRLIDLALDSGAMVDGPDWGYYFGFETESLHTPLQAAAMVGNLTLVKDLLRRGANINTPAAPRKGMTALQAACSRYKSKPPDIELVWYLLQHGADVNAPPAKYGGKTALQQAALEGDVSLVQLLLSNGAKVNAQPARKRGRTALEAAAEAGNIPLVLLLLFNGAEINAFPLGESHCALDTAATRGRLDVAMLLMDLGAVSGVRRRTDYDGAIGVASYHGHRTVEKMIRSYAERKRTPK